MLVKKSNFGQKIKFWSKNKILFENSNFGQQIKFWSKNQISVKKIKFWSNNQILAKREIGERSSFFNY